MARSYTSRPDTDVSHRSNTSLKPRHLFFLERMFPGISRSESVQAAIDELAQSRGLSEDDWINCQEKEKYVVGVRSVRKKKDSKASQQ